MLSYLFIKDIFEDINWGYSNMEIALETTFYSLFIIATIPLDILLFPFEIIYLINLYFVRKLRKREENK